MFLLKWQLWLEPHLLWHIYSCLLSTRCDGSRSAVHLGERASCDCVVANGIKL